MRQRVFRIERQIAGARAPVMHRVSAGCDRSAMCPAHVVNTPREDIPTCDPLDELRRELELVHDAVDKSKHELASFKTFDSGDSRVARSTLELGDAVDAMERATQTILKMAESIDDTARALHASHQSEYNRAMTQDILENVVRIYEACNFQDISGQQIAKAIATLRFVDDHVKRLLDIWGDIRKPPQAERAEPVPVGRALAHGPKLVGDQGHVTQTDVDRMFEGI